MSVQEGAQLAFRMRMTVLVTEPKICHCKLQSWPRHKNVHQFAACNDSVRVFGKAAWKVYLVWPLGLAMRWFQIDLTLATEHLIQVVDESYLEMNTCFVNGSNFTEVSKRQEKPRLCIANVISRHMWRGFHWWRGQLVGFRTSENGNITQE